MFGQIQKYLFTGECRQVKLIALDHIRIKIAAFEMRFFNVGKQLSSDEIYLKRDIKVTLHRRQASRTIDLERRSYQAGYFSLGRVPPKLAAHVYLAKDSDSFRIQVDLVRFDLKVELNRPIADVKQINDHCQTE